MLVSLLILMILFAFWAAFQPHIINFLTNLGTRSGSPETDDHAPFSNERSQKIAAGTLVLDIEEPDRDKIYYLV